MKKLNVILFFIGFLIELFAFIVSHPHNILLVQKILFSKSYNANEAIKEMEKTKFTTILKPDAIGFNEIEKIILEEIKRQNKSDFFVDVNVLYVKKRAPETRLSGNGAVVVTPLKIGLSNKKVIDGEIKFLKDKIKNLQNNFSFVVSVTIFMFGALIQFVSFYIDKFTNISKNIP